MKRKEHMAAVFAVTPKTAATSPPAGDAEFTTVNLPAAAGPRQHVQARGVRTIAMSLDKIEREGQALRDALAAGDKVVELDADRIEVSFIRDRLPEAEGDFESFKRSIAENGQEVPILVRPHPKQDDFFQIAYGHRRTRACLSLGLKVKAVVRPLTDLELVVAQGVENAQRKDLSYVERALYAARLEDRRFERAVICDALAVSKSEVSMLIGVARGIPEDVIAAVGSAPKVGRPRWQALCEALKAPEAKRRASAAAARREFREVSSDERFTLVMTAVLPRRAKPSGTPDVTMSMGRGTEFVRYRTKGDTLHMDVKGEEAFRSYLIQELPRLYERYEASNGPANVPATKTGKD